MQLVYDYIQKRKIKRFSGIWEASMNITNKTNTTNIAVRNITKEDGPILRKLASDCGPLDVHTPYTYWVVSSFFGETGFVLEEEEKPIGYIMNLQKNDILFIWQIGILSEYRGNKFTRKLLDAVFKYARENGIKEILVTIASENKTSYFSFEKYCQLNKMVFEKAKEVKITDLIDEGFCECEIMYRIEIAK